jgi:hypothetical protein
MALLAWPLYMMSQPGNGRDREWFINLLPISLISFAYQSMRSIVLTSTA